MAEYISRQKAIEAIMDLPNCPNGYSDTYDKECIIGTLDEVPTADVRENVHAKWEQCEVFGIDESTIDEWQSEFCPNCKTYLTTPYMYSFHRHNFCPNCGAEMEE